MSAYTLPLHCRDCGIPLSYMTSCAPACVHWITLLSDCRCPCSMRVPHSQATCQEQIHISMRRLPPHHTQRLTCTALQPPAWHASTQSAGRLPLNTLNILRFHCTMATLLMSIPVGGRIPSLPPPATLPAVHCHSCSSQIHRLPPARPWRVILPRLLPRLPQTRGCCPPCKPLAVSAPQTC